MSSISQTSTAWTVASRFESPPRSESPYSPTMPYNRGNLVTPPGSGTMTSPPMNNINGNYSIGLPPIIGPGAGPQGGRRPSESVSGGPSPPASASHSRSSDGTLSDVQSRKYRRMEEKLELHYILLRRYLNGSQLQMPRPNKARDKLLRLSPVQFLELSTDVYDELQRRQAAAQPNGPPGRPGPRSYRDVPPHLLARDDFHEKRNQARQKLSSLQAQRFRDLATDVFCELERRFPQFKDPISNGRMGSPAQNMRGPASRGGAPMDQRPPPLGPNGFGVLPRSTSRGGPWSKGPFPAGSGAGPGQAGFGGMSQDRRPSESSFGGPSLTIHGSNVFSDDLLEADYDRPVARHFQSNILTPNKSIMVEDDDDYDSIEDHEDRRSNAFDLDGVSTDPHDDRVDSLLSKSESLPTRDELFQQETQTKFAELQARLYSSESMLRAKYNEIRRLHCEWADVKQDMGKKVNESDALRRKVDDSEAMLRAKYQELRRLQCEWADVKQDLAKKMDDSQAMLRAKYNEVRRLHCEWADVKQDMERKLGDAEIINMSLKDELERLHSDRATVEKDLRHQVDEASSSQTADSAWKAKHENLSRDHEDLKLQLQQQRKVTEEVRNQASGFLREMRAMADGGGGNWEREEQMRRTVQKLESEVKEWKARYTKTKTQLRSFKATSLGLGIQTSDATWVAKDHAFVRPDGLVEDVHVTKFQISIDELLRAARGGNPSEILECVKAVVMAVRSITQDVDALSNPANLADERSQRTAKLRAKLSATANNVITAAKNMIASNGLSPVSLLDAAASHLTAAVIDLVRHTKIRATTTGEHDDVEIHPEHEIEEKPEVPLQNPEYFNAGKPIPRTSVHQSEISSISIPASIPEEGRGVAGRPGAVQEPESRSSGLSNVQWLNGTVKPSVSLREQQQAELEELKIYLEDQTDSLVQSIQSLVGSIRAEDHISNTRIHMLTIASVVGNVVSATEGAISHSSRSSSSAGGGTDRSEGRESSASSLLSSPPPLSLSLRENAGPMVKRLADAGQRLLDAREESEKLDDADEVGVRKFAQGLPPLAFQVAREMKGLVQGIEKVGWVEEEDGEEVDDVNHNHGVEAPEGRKEGRFVERS